MTEGSGVVDEVGFLESLERAIAFLAYQNEQFLEGPFYASRRYKNLVLIAELESVADKVKGGAFCDCRY